AALSLLPIALVLGHADWLAWAAIGAALGALGSLFGDHSDAPRWTKSAVLVSLAWTAGWLWAGGGALVAAWIVVATAAVGRGERPRSPFVMLAVGSVAGVLVAALISRP
ncbi:MAG: hypothetical protein ACRDXC_11545, partial [Acidimicrobiales bacterium]